MPQERKRLGDFLVDSGRINKEQLGNALQYQRDHNVYLGKAVVALGFLTEKQLTETLSEQLGIPYLDLENFEIGKDVLKVMDEKVARKYKVMPLFLMDNSLTLAVADPLNVEIVDDLTLQTGMEINLVLATESEIEKAIDLFYGGARYEERTKGKDGQPSTGGVISREIGEDTEIVEALNILFNEAIKMGASDIHIEPREYDIRIRFRVDGVLQHYYTVPKASAAPLVSRVKILAGMDIAEARKPQDGSFSYTSGDIKVDMRTSTYPSSHGEKAVLRILDESKSRIDLHKLGFNEEVLNLWRRIIRSPNGIVLVSGPTGSGKTTTLYATLNVINKVDVNIITIEDPIEYNLENIIQAQINLKAGLTFVTALRGMLRQDPDILMVGEMRDVETITLAIRAALTGHLVFTTIHTNDAASSYTRLLDMGIDPYLVSSTVRAILAQRLIRLLCPRCKQTVEPDDKMMTMVAAEAQIDPEILHKGTIYKAVGCIHCKNTGYFGRAGIYELLISNEEIISMVLERATSNKIQEAAIRNGMVSLKEAALQYVLTGKTSLDEMLKNIQG